MDNSDHWFVTQVSLFKRINQAEAGPRELAWEEFRARYAPIIAGFARNMGARQQDWDDIVQDVLMGFYAQSPTFVYDPSKGRFRGYLKVCTMRIIRDRFGKSLTFNSVPLEKVDPASLEVEQAWNDVWEQQQLRRAIQAVKADYAKDEASAKTFKAFELYVMESMSPDDVAAKVGISAASVYKAKERVTDAIRRKLADLKGEEG